MMEVAIGGMMQARPARPWSAPRSVREDSAPPAETAAYNEAFCQAYEVYYTKVFAFVYSRVREVELARDIVGEVFERAYVKGSSVRDRSAYAAWLFMIAKNCIAGHFRRHKRELSHQQRVQEELCFLASPPEPEDKLLQGERTRHLMSHLRRLPPRDQELISLKFDAELTHEEIGRIMGMSALNVRVSIFRALKRLKARMDSDLGG